MSTVDLCYRKANLNDSSFLLTLRNHESVRTKSKNSDEISQSAHDEWFRFRLDNEESLGPILIFFIEDVPIGFSRIDISKGDSAILSIAVQIDYRNMGFGRRILELTKLHSFEVLKVFKLFASINVKNSASIKIFELVGFHQDGIEDSWMKLSLNGS